MPEQAITVNLAEETLSALADAAQREGLSVEQLVPLVLDSYLAEMLSLQEDLAEADRQIAAGNTVSHEEMVAEFEARFAARKRTEAA